MGAVPVRWATTSPAVAAGRMSMPSTTPASQAFSRGRKRRTNPRRLASMAMGSTPATRRRSPLRESSPRKADPDRSALSCCEAQSTPR